MCIRDSYTGVDDVVIEADFAIFGKAVINQRSTALVCFFKNGQQVTRYETASYHRLTGDGWMTGTREGVFTMSTGDTISVRAKENNNGDNVEVDRPRSTFKLEIKRQ